MRRLQQEFLVEDAFGDNRELTGNIALIVVQLMHDFRVRERLVWGADARQGYRFRTKRDGEMVLMSGRGKACRACGSVVSA